MARSRVTISVDRDKLAAAQAVIGTSSASATVDAALSEVLRRAQLRHDIEAYRRLPPTEDGMGLSRAHANWGDLADETDWDTE